MDMDQVPRQWETRVNFKSFAGPSVEFTIVAEPDAGAAPTDIHCLRDDGGALSSWTAGASAVPWR